MTFDLFDFVSVFVLVIFCCIENCVVGTLTMSLKLYYQNVRGMKTKCQHIKSNIISRDYDILVFTETWLNESVYDYEFCDDRYLIFRRDRTRNSLNCKREGGGVLVAVRKDIRARRQLGWECDCELLWLTIPVTGKLTNYCFINICVVYVPPPLKADYIDNLCENIEHRIATSCSAASLNLLIGDFNLPNIEWQKAADNLYYDASMSSSTLVTSVIDCFNYSNLRQCNGIGNNISRTLDLILTNYPEDIGIQQCSAPISYEDKYHPALTVKIEAAPKKMLKPNATTTYNFYSANFDAINSQLAHINWRYILDSSGTHDIDLAVAKLYSHLQSVIKDHVPIRKRKTARFPVWYSRALIRAIGEKNKYHRKFKKFNNAMDRLTFNIIRTRCTKLIKKCYAEYKQNTERNIKKNPKFFWSFVKNTKRNSSTMPERVAYGTDTACDGQSICNLFAKYFNSVYKQPSQQGDSQARSLDYFNNCLGSIHVSRADVAEVLSKSDASKGAGPDGIPIYFLKQCSKQLTAPLTIIFNLSLSLGQFPTIWKVAHVVPIPKSQNLSSVDNYRPISILCAMGKLFERILIKKLYWFFKPYIIPEQHGFLPKKSTATNLTSFTDDVLIALDRGHEVHAIYTDFSKAFDVVDHQVLLRKLMLLGIHGSLLRWFESYLRNRSQIVVTGGYRSDRLPIASGVAQGSHLGPLLFVVFINDALRNLRSSKGLFYADDLKIYKEVTCTEDCLLLQEDVDGLYVWCEENKMNLNISKCCHIKFSRKRNPAAAGYTIKGETLRETFSLRDLGVEMDKSARFTLHIDKIIKKAYKSLGFIIRMTKVFSMAQTINILYNSYVRSVLEYCSTVWNPVYNIHRERLERVQKRFLYHLCFKFNLCKTVPTYADRLSYFRMETLADRRSRADLIFLYKLLNGHIDCPELLSKISLQVHRHNSRLIHRSPFALPGFRTNMGSHAPVARMLSLANKNRHILDIFNSSTAQLKCFRLES